MQQITSEATLKLLMERNDVKAGTGASTLRLPFYLDAF
jgi:hypothetical protein